MVLWLSLAVVELALMLVPAPVSVKALVMLGTPPAWSPIVTLAPLATVTALVERGRYLVLSAYSSPPLTVVVPV